MTSENYQADGVTCLTQCSTCGRNLANEQARAVLLDPGDPDDGTGGLFILMPYALSMSAEAGPYCYTDAAHRLARLNSRGPWTAASFVRARKP
jgi:hypothetical protein